MIVDRTNETRSVLSSKSIVLLDQASLMTDGSLNSLSRSGEALERSRGVTDRDYVSNVTCSVMQDDASEWQLEAGSMEIKDGRSCCSLATSMAGDDQRAENYIVDVPFSVLLNIYQSLDADKGWEQLASETGYTFDKIRLLELEGARSNGSPSRSLLWELGSRNTTVRQLYHYLSSLQRYREMKILEDYVNSPAKPVVPYNGLKGLKSPGSSMNNVNASQDSKSANSFTSSSSARMQNSINFNQIAASSDVKQYSGKQMPILSPSSSFDKGISNGVDSSHPVSIHAPGITPCNPSRALPTNCSSTNLQSNGIQRPCVLQSSISLSSLPQPPPPLIASQSTSWSSPISSSPLSSSLSSLPGWDKCLDSQYNMITCFKWSEVVQATNNFSEQNKIGAGAFGNVYYGVLHQNKCAVKKMIEADGEETDMERSAQVKRELTSLMKYRHENIVTLYGYALETQGLCLVYQFMPNGSLEDRLMRKGNRPPLVWSQRLYILLGVCQGLNFLHTMGEQPLIHGDIKSANILLDKHMEAKIGDLGLAQQATACGADSTTKRLTHITREQTTTKWYRTHAYQSTELRTGGRPSTKGDIYSLGVVLLEIFSGEQAHDERREGDKFLGDYFHSLSADNKLEAFLAKIDKSAGECPREVALTLLRIADACTSELKRKRPDSGKLLLEVVAVDDLYREKTGIKNTSMNSFHGSEHSCHLSHTSAPEKNVDNLSGAPNHNLQHTQSQHLKAGAQPNSNIDISQIKISATYKAKLDAIQHQLPSPDNGSENSLVVNLNTDSLSCHAIHRMSQNDKASSVPSRCQVQPFDNPRRYLPKDQPLPPAFRLQEAYDRQHDGQAKKKPITRLSHCGEVAWREGGGAEDLPKADPDKLAKLEQFDKLNLNGSCQGEKADQTEFMSDPKKLAALHFEEGVYSPTPENVSELLAMCEADNLACDPKKLACLKMFDDDNVKASHVVRQAQREQEEAISNSHRLAILTKSDSDSNTDSSTIHAGSIKQSRGLDGTDRDKSSLVQQVVTSQMEACKSTAQQEHVVQQTNLPSSHSDELAAQAASCQETCCRNPTAASEQENKDELLSRRNKMFETFDLLKKQYIEGGSDDEGNETFEELEETCDYRGVHLSQQSYDNGNLSQMSAPEVANSQYHAAAIEQGESTLNYFKSREQHYAKTSKKPQQASQC